MRSALARFILRHQRLGRKLQFPDRTSWNITSFKSWFCSKKRSFLCQIKVKIISDQGPWVFQTWSLVCTNMTRDKTQGTGSKLVQFLESQSLDRLRSPGHQMEGLRNKFRWLVRHVKFKMLRFIRFSCQFYLLTLLCLWSWWGLGTETYKGRETSWRTCATSSVLFFALVKKESNKRTMGDISGDMNWGLNEG